VRRGGGNSCEDDVSWCGGVLVVGGGVVATAVRMAPAGVEG